jgi:uncharacterized protein (TIGR02996 family)
LPEFAVTHDDFLQAVLDNPDDDAPRLAFADWLEEHGDPERAEFIRVQVELAGLPEDDDRQYALAARERALLGRHEQEWAGSLGRGQSRPTFRRGFVSHLFIDAQTLPEAADAAFTVAPLDGLIVLKARGSVQRLAACSHLQRLAELIIGGGIDGSYGLLGDDLRHLVACPHLGRLRRLGLFRSRIRFDHFQSLVESPLFARLTRLHLIRCEFSEGAGVRAAEALAASPASRGLEELSLEATDVLSAGLRALVASPHLAGLKSLLLFSIGSCKVLAAFGQLAGLRSLTLGHLHDDRRHLLDDEDVAALAVAPWVSGLRELNLTSNYIEDAGVAALAASHHLGRLRVLDLQGNRIGVAGFQALAASPNLAGLRTLRLSDNRCGDAGVEALAASPSLRGLRVLEVGGGGVGDASVRALAAAGLVELRELLVISAANVGGGPGITNEGARSLLWSPHLTRLTRLTLRGTSISDKLKEGLRERFGEAVCDIP